MVEKYMGISPETDPSSFVHNMAYVQGNVKLSKRSSVWPGASVRADIDKISIGENSNIQDNATVHVGHGHPAIIGKNVTVGHNAIVHGATVGDNCIIGMGSVILDGTVIGNNCVIGAGAVIPGNRVIPENSVVIGNPYKILKQTSDEDVKGIIENANEYYVLSCRIKEGGAR